ncbi:hypothetical protein Sango_0104400 [Sesamum angolense]|uniref:Uncharacterized protein n=1 Tax=Sesamum angolense TaxID=2727404 RepID=A0AAE2C610_9LAMI|nr:hypothetical protein Sango_0104400 [Sesamum angolense]
MDSRKLKRGRSVGMEAVAAPNAAKKVAPGKGKQEEKVVEEVEVSFPVAEEMAEWAGLWSGVDEEMAWASCWWPFWEMEIMGDPFDALYGDVWWGFDIWDLKGSCTAPNP